MVAKRDRVGRICDSGKVGWIVSRGGRESHDVWLEVATGLVTLIR
jgi:hypothetical protein